MELLSRLRSAVKKLTFLLNLKKYLSLQSTWRLSSFMRARAPAAITGRRRWRRRRAMSFNDRPGLRACVDLDTPDHEYDYIYDGDDQGEGEGQGGRSGGSSSATSPYSLRRALSCPPEDEDVDKRSEMFIENFYRQLQYERQISLDLRYCQGNSSNNYSFKSSSESVVSPLSSVDSQLLSPS